MRRFKSARHAQRFVEVHGIIASHFRPRRHLLSSLIIDDSVVNDFKFGTKLPGRLLSAKSGFGAERSAITRMILTGFYNRRKLTVPRASTGQQFMRYR